MAEASDSRGRRPARGGAVYILVLAMSMILALVGVSAVTLSRVNMRAAVEGGNWYEARGLAFSGAEHAMSTIHGTPAWRTTYSGQTVEKSLGRGSFSWRLVDEADGNLADNATQGFAVISTGTARGASYALHVTMTMPAGGRIQYGLGTPSTIAMSSNAYIDSYDSTLGAYGGGNKGSNASVATNSTAAGGVSLSSNSEIRGSAQVGPGGNPSTVISPPSAVTGSKTAMAQAMESPTVTEPGGMGASTGNLTTGNDNTVTINSNRHVGNLTLSNNSTIQISGDVTILADSDVVINNNAKVRVLANSSLKLYVKGNLTVNNNATGTVVDGANLSRLQMLMVGGGTVDLKGNASVYGVIVAPDSVLKVASNAAIFGAVLAKSVTMSSNAAIHEDKRITGGTDPVTLGTGSQGTPCPAGWRQVVQ